MRHLIAMLVLGGLVQDRPEAPVIAADDFERLQELFRPQAGESPWREIEWMTSIRGARERAAAEGKPILVFTAADGSPLART
jgi:hypothetical protein